MADNPKATYNGDTQNFHKYIIDPGQEITGILYFPITLKEVPKEITIELKGKRKLDS